MFIRDRKLKDRQFGVTSDVTQAILKLVTRAEPEGKTFNLRFNLCSRPHERLYESPYERKLWIATKRMRLWLKVAQMSQMRN